MPSLTGELTTITLSTDSGRSTSRLFDRLVGGDDDELDIRPLYVGADDRIEILRPRRIERNEKLVGDLRADPHRTVRKIEAAKGVADIGRHHRHGLLPGRCRRIWMTVLTG